MKDDFVADEGELAKDKKITGVTEESKRIFSLIWRVLGVSLVPNSFNDSGLFLKINDNNPITYDNAFPMKNQTFISEIRVNYVQYMIFAQDMEKLMM